MDPGGIWIQEAQKLVDPVDTDPDSDQDPQHWFKHPCYC